MKKKLSVILLFALLLNLVLPVASSADTLYAPDGRTIDVYSWEVPKWVNVGWHQAVTLYAPDGRTISVSPFATQQWINVGWYTYPVTTMYAPDGRSIVVSSSDVGNWVAVGWAPTSFTADTQYYPGTSIPTYTSVTGVQLKDTRYDNDGKLVYIYPNTKYGEYSEVIDYYGYFLDRNWIDATDKINNDDLDNYAMAFISPSLKEGVLMMVSFDLDEVWIGPQNYN